jgi:hypothetical protein
MSDIIVYIDRSEVARDNFPALKAGLLELASLAERLEPRLISYGFHLDESLGALTVVVVHPDSGSLEFHMETLASEFRKLGPLLRLNSIEVYGQVSTKAMDLLRKKAADLGDAGVTVSPRYAGFSRAPTQVTV